MEKIKEISAGNQLQHHPEPGLLGDAVELYEVGVVEAGHDVDLLGKVRELKVRVLVLARQQLLHGNLRLARPQRAQVDCPKASLSQLSAELQVLAGDDRNVREGEVRRQEAHADHVRAARERRALRHGLHALLEGKHLDLPLQRLLHERRASANSVADLLLGEAVRAGQHSADVRLHAVEALNHSLHRVHDLAQQQLPPLLATARLHLSAEGLAHAEREADVPLVEEKAGSLVAEARHDARPPEEHRLHLLRVHDTHHDLLEEAQRQEGEGVLPAVLHLSFRSHRGPRALEELQFLSFWPFGQHRWDNNVSREVQARSDVYHCKPLEEGHQLLVDARRVLGCEDVRGEVGDTELSVLDPRVAERDQAGHQVCQPLGVQHHQVVHGRLGGRGGVCGAAGLSVEDDRADIGEERGARHHLAVWHARLTRPLAVGLPLHLLELHVLALHADVVVEADPRLRDARSEPVLRGDLYQLLLQLFDAHAGLAADWHDALQTSVAVLGEVLAHIVQLVQNRLL
mmetsp:Transcript_5090/g.18874  ORF Transcript_5090/g.18874 Transcript_5090/m.18874 type:complete len:515 (-) Transcript_5090:102-1646(-)